MLSVPLLYSVPSEAPQLLEAMYIQPSEVAFKWRAVPCDQQNGLITGYVLRYYATCGADRGQQNMPVVTTGDIETMGSTRIEDLTPNTEYALQVAAINVNGTGPFSGPVILEGE